MPGCRAAAILEPGGLRRKEDHTEMLFSNFEEGRLEKQESSEEGTVAFVVGNLQGQNWTFRFVERDEAPLWPVLQPVDVPLNGSMPTWCVRLFSQFCIITKLAEDKILIVMSVDAGETLGHMEDLALITDIPQLLQKSYSARQGMERERYQRGWKAPFKYWKAAMRSPRSLVFFRLNNPNSLSLSSRGAPALGSFSWPPLDPLQQLPVLLVLRAPELDAVLQVPLDDIPSFWCVSCTTQLGVICKRAEGALDLAVNVIDENIEQCWSQYGPLRDTTQVCLHWRGTIARDPERFIPSVARSPAAFEASHRELQSIDSFLKHGPGILHISENQCTDETGRYLWRSSSPTSLPKHGQYGRLLRAMFSQVLNISMDGDSTTSLGNLFQCPSWWSEEDTPKQAEPWQDVLHAEKPVLYELSCRSPSNWHKIKQPCSYSNLHQGVALRQLLDLKRPELNKLSIKPIMLKSNIQAKNIQGKEKLCRLGGGKAKQRGGKVKEDPSNYTNLDLRIGEFPMPLRGFDNCAVACARPQKPTESEDECNPVFPRKQISTQFHSKVDQKRVPGAAPPLQPVRVHQSHVVRCPPRSLPLPPRRSPGYDLEVIKDISMKTVKIHKKLGVGTARIADPNWPKGYSIPYDVMFSMFSTHEPFPAALLYQGGDISTQRQQLPLPPPGTILDRFKCQNRSQGADPKPTKVNNKSSFAFKGACDEFTLERKSQETSSTDRRTGEHEMINLHLFNRDSKFRIRPQLAGWRLNHFPGQPGPMLDNPYSEVKFPNIQSKPPRVQLEAISSHPITCYLGEETDPHLSTTSFQAKQPQFPQPLLIRLLLQTLHQLHCPSLDTLQHLSVLLVVRGPKLNTVFESLPTLQQINTPAQLGVICKLTEGALDHFVQIIDKDIKQNWPQHRALGNTTCDWRPTGVNSIHHHSLGLGIQPVLYPAKSTPIQAMSSQFLQENAVGNRVKGFTEV
ncbi:LOW QUALITY PROTEIN: hypothetical protein QYF61_020580 [Mycteria americana]|uniref:Uncharacterized protein n=1 Tax=Mycteria americana TaxID=33587 RepID=A0AAN7NRM5_MYCAM|nr:LOW QUALITY PROTEIN: hypothetical protein QYF61_020580 [Mycteria americana]